MPVRKPRKTATDLLHNINDGKSVLRFHKNQVIFQEGQNADAVYFVQSGKIKLTVVSPAGREAILSLLGPGDFFGEACLAGHAIRAETATALEPSVIVRVEKNAMEHGLNNDLRLSEAFIAVLLVQNIRLKEDLCDQFFNHSERRLARVLLKIAELNQQGAVREIKVPKIAHETLAEMVGTTRSRVTRFMNEFRKQGLIDYGGELTIRPTLLTEAILRD
jgi:CRP-like cAMP-binding protein